MDGEAEEAYRAANEADQNFTQPYYGLARIYLKRKETGRAVEQYSAMLEKNPDMIGPHMLLGVLYDAQHQPELSEKHYREVLRINPDFAAAANNLAFLLAEKGDQLDEALMLAQRAKEKLPEDPSVMDYVGVGLLQKRGFTTARWPSLRRVSRSCPTMPVCITIWGWCMPRSRRLGWPGST